MQANQHTVGENKESPSLRPSGLIDSLARSITFLLLSSCSSFFLPLASSLLLFANKRTRANSHFCWNPTLFTTLTSDWIKQTHIRSCSLNLWLLLSSVTPLIVNCLYSNLGFIMIRGKLYPLTHSSLSAAAPHSSCQKNDLLFTCFIYCLLFASIYSYWSIQPASLHHYTHTYLINLA